jgi:AmmeMemoRadiSam system protein A
MTEERYTTLSPEERHTLLSLARAAVLAAARGDPLPSVDLRSLPPSLCETRACFVTLHKYGQLRGCTGTLVAQAPLAKEVVHTAAQTALSDPRFRPVTPAEVDELEIEISILTPSTPLELKSPLDLPRKIRPGVDGVTLYRGFHRATFLPQVWERIPDPEQFLAMLCQKMGLPPQEWRQPGIRAEVYQSETFSESDTPAEE